MYKVKLSPEEALETIKLRMKYDSSKTLTENVSIIKEQVDIGGDIRDIKDELDAAVSQVSNKRYVAMTLKTDDPAREQAHLAFVRDIEPNLKPIGQTLRNKYLDSPFRPELLKETYILMDRALENRKSLYREANIPKETRVSELTQQYQKLVEEKGWPAPGIISPLEEQMKSQVLDATQLYAPFPEQALSPIPGLSYRLRIKEDATRVLEALNLTQLERALGLPLF